MALPPDLQQGIITGGVKSLQTGAPLPVIITFTPDFDSVNDLPGGTIGDPGSILLGPVDPIVVDTSVTRAGTTGMWDYAVTAGGAVTVRLLGYSDGVNPSKFTYHCTIKLKSDPSKVLKDFHFTIPAGSTLDLSALAPVKASAGAGASVIQLIQNGGGSGGVSKWGDLQEKPEYIAAGTSAKNARDAIGAGTSSLVIGTDANTAWAGNRRPKWSELDQVPSLALSGHTHTLDDIAGTTSTGKDILGAGSPGAALTKLGVSDAAATVIKAATTTAMQDALGIPALITEAVTAALATTPRISYDPAYVPVGNRPVIYVTEVYPAAVIRSQDRWLADAPAS